MLELKDVNALNDKEKWCGIKIIALVRNYRGKYDNLSIDDHYYISVLDISASYYQISLENIGL